MKFEKPKRLFFSIKMPDCNGMEIFISVYNLTYMSQYRAGFGTFHLGVARGSSSLFSHLFFINQLHIVVWRELIMQIYK